MNNKKNLVPEDEAENKSSRANENYEYATGEVEALRAILGKTRKKDESDKEEKANESGKNNRVKNT